MMLNKERTAEPGKQTTLPEPRLPTTTLTSFATDASLQFNDTLVIQRDIPTTNLQKWCEDESYMETCHLIERLHIANDMAETGVLVTLV